VHGLPTVLLLLMPGFQSAWRFHVKSLTYGVDPSDIDVLADVQRDAATTISRTKSIVSISEYLNPFMAHSLSDFWDPLLVAQAQSPTFMGVFNLSGIIYP
jgi:hypothetical protein